MTQIDGLRLTGNYAFKLVNKEFTVMKLHKEKMLDPESKEEIFKWLLTVKLADGKIRDWIPNHTSMQMMADRFGDDSEDFIGKKAKFKVTEQKVRGQFTKVIYVE